MIPLAHSQGNRSCLLQGGFSATKRSRFFERNMAVELSRKGFTPYAAKKGEECMTAGQRKRFRETLESRTSERPQDIDRTVQPMQDEATVSADPTDPAIEESDMALELRNRDRERKLIKKIYE